MGRDDSWPATVHGVVPTGDCSYRSIHYIQQPNQPISVWMGEVPTQKHPKRWNRTSDRESDGRVWIGKPSFLVTTGLSRLVSEIFACDRQMDNADHYYSWLPHCGGPANNTAERGQESV